MPKHHSTTHEDNPTPADAPEAPELAQLRDDLVRLTDERDSLQEQLLRTMADFQNFRKRVQSENEQLRIFATERLVTQMLPVLDNFERSLAALDAGAKPEAIVEGIRAVDRQMRTILESHNVTRIPSAGHPFDPEVHEALAMEASENHPEGTVLDEIEAGYKMAEKVIRPARVKVSRKP